MHPVAQGSKLTQEVGEGCLAVAGAHEEEIGQREAEAYADVRSENLHLLPYRI